MAREGLVDSKRRVN